MSKIKYDLLPKQKKLKHNLKVESKKIMKIYGT